ncbi:MAG: tetratricopeptide repeat protein [Endomicrobiales bacterium]|nr:tetratricopeptide repeat protein [Endomicrobiales bacterium]
MNYKRINLLFFLIFLLCVFSALSFCDVLNGLPQEQVFQSKNKNKNYKLCLQNYNQAISSQNFNAALNSLEQAIGFATSNKKRYELFVMQGDTYLNIKQYAKSIEKYGLAIDLVPQEEVAKLKLAGVFETIELYTRAQDVYFDVLTYNPKSFDAIYAIALSYFRDGLYTKALDYFLKALSLRPQNDLYRKTALCANYSGQSDLAVSLLENLTKNVRSYDDYFLMGELLTKKSEYKKSIAVLTDAINLDKENGSAYLYIGINYLLQNDVESAKKNFKLASQKLSNGALPHFFLAMIYNLQEDNSKALAELSKANELATSPVVKQYCEKLRILIDFPSKKLSNAN